MPSIKLVGYGISKDIIGQREVDYQTSQLSDIAALKTELVERYPDFAQLVKFSLAVNEEYRNDDFKLQDGDEVVIIPPVSGG